MRTLALFLYASAGDAVLLFAGVPLQRYALWVASAQPENKRLIALLLAANLALLVVLISAALAGFAGFRDLARALRRRRVR